MDLLTILRLAPWAIAVLAIGFGLLMDANDQGEKAARAADQATAEKAVADAMAADAAKTQQLEATHAAEVAQLKEDANARDIAIAAAPATDVCAASPAMRALFDGLRGNAGASGPGQPAGSH